MHLKYVLGSLPVLLAMVSTLLHAQRIDTIRANPDAVQLRKIWQVTGGEFGGGRVGDGIGSVGDINGDGVDDWAVHEGDAYAWKIYYGSRDGLSTEPVRVIQGLGGAYPVVGDFWGTGHKAVGFTRVESGSVNGTQVFHYMLSIFRTDSNRLDSTPTVEFAPQRMHPSTVIASNVRYEAVDLDNDGANELVVFTGGSLRNDSLNKHPEVWIFRGGENFQVDTPTVVITDSEQHGSKANQSLVIGEVDGDGRPDLITGSDYADGTQKQKFYFSNSGSPWNWTQPDRVVQMNNFVQLDCDGDGLLDMAMGAPASTVSLYLSSSGKDIHTRTFASDDADRQYFVPQDNLAYPLRLGHLNDSAGHYDMLGINVNGVKQIFGGGVGGPDGLYDCYSGDMYGRVAPVGDLTGDGWDEVMSSNSTVNFNSGYAAIYTGGPYIPRDPSLGVHHIATMDREDAISIWPTPATTEVHIAWRGDLKRMPRGFMVHDVLGRLIAQGDVPSWQGEVRWTCDGQPAGVYLLTIVDYLGQSIASARMIKQ